MWNNFNCKCSDKILFHQEVFYVRILDLKNHILIKNVKSLKIPNEMCVKCANRIATK